MSDLRGLSRGSKTAAVVVLVVLLQVIVVAVLGLGAIGRDREEGARRARDQAAANALTLARRVIAETAEGLIGAVEDSAKVALNTGGLRNRPRTGWLAAVREFYRVDADGRVRAAEGTLLHVPPDVAQALAERYARSEIANYDVMLSRQLGTDPDTLVARHRFVTTFPVLTDETRWALAVGEALRLAEDVAAARASPIPILEAVRLAYETAAINESRPTANQPGFAHVSARLRVLVAGLPEADRVAAAGLLADLDHAREGLASFLDVVLPLAKQAAAHPAPPQILTQSWGSGLEVIALDALGRIDGRPGEALLVRFDRRMIAALAQAPAMLPDGAAVRVVARDTPDARDGALRLALERLPSFDPSLDVIVERAGRPATEAAAGPRETFYWFILGLATLGVSIAGVVLVRILRREVVLARLKADFVSNLSHELKTPLTSISMFTEMIREGKLEGDELREGIAVIGDESDRLQRIVSRMIDVARREAEGTGYALKPADLNGPVRAACERLRRLEHDPNLVLDVNLDPELPPVLLDEGAIDDAVTNLLSNAWKYRRGDAAHIRVATRRAGRRVEVTVEDDGIGIPKHERRRVFEMFYRADNYLSKSVPGTGLGLALVRTIVRVHKGKIRLDAAPSGGSLFRLRFPIARGGVLQRDAAPPDAVPKTSPLPASAPASPRTTSSAPARATGDRR
jgi:two-component system phosphate regulon sensor histidine kinase PhoR